MLTVYNKFSYHAKLASLNSNLTLCLNSIFTLLLFSCKPFYSIPKFPEIFQFFQTDFPITINNREISIGVHLYNTLGTRGIIAVILENERKILYYPLLLMSLEIVKKLSVDLGFLGLPLTSPVVFVARVNKVKR